MIAKVRIAPIERWCESSRRGLSPKVPRHEIENFFVLIDTDSMGPSGDCEGNSWLVEEQQATDTRSRHGLNLAPPTRFRVCEHMLEMD